MFRCYSLETSHPLLLPQREILFKLLHTRGTCQVALVVKKWSKVSQSCLTLCDPVDCSPPGSSVHGILQARILEWIAISFYRGSSQPRDRTQVSCIAGRRFNLWATREVVKNSPANAGDVKDVGSIPVSGRSPGGGSGNTLQNFCLENPMDRGAWWVVVHGVAKRQRQLKWLNVRVHTHTWSRLSDYVGDPQVSGQLLPSHPHCRKFAVNHDFMEAVAHCVFSIPLGSWQFLVGKSALKIVTFNYFGNALMKGNIPDRDYKLEHGTIIFFPKGNVY